VKTLGLDLYAHLITSADSLAWSLDARLLRRPSPGAPTTAPPRTAPHACPTPSRSASATSCTASHDPRRVSGQRRQPTRSIGLQAVARRRTFCLWLARFPPLRS